MHISGWYDDEQAGAVMNYIGMTQKGATEEIRKNQKLLMGPWPHAVNSPGVLEQLILGPTAQIDLESYELRWFDHWLRDEDNAIMNDPPVRIFLMGRNEWQDHLDWPIPGTQFVRYYLNSKGRANSLFGDGSLDPQPPKNKVERPLYIRSG